MKPLIEVNAITYRHVLPGQPNVRESEDVLPALDGVSLQIHPGEFVAIIGSNGSGKTTLARHFNALLLPTAGEVIVAGLDTRHPESLAAIRRKVGMVFQYPEDQLVAATVEEDIAFGPENLGLPPAEIRQRVARAMEMTGTTELRQRAPYQLSAGQMQRTALAGVLAIEPDCIVFDEASAMLDPTGRRELLSHILSLHKAGLTVIYITHFMEEAALADRLVVLNTGRLVADGTPASVFSQVDQLESWGVEPPPATLLANRLRPFFPSLPASILHPEELIAGLPIFPSSTATNEIVAQTQPKDPAEDAVAVENLHYAYGRGTPFEQPALSGVSLSIGEQTIHGLVGATGSGKSTLLQHLNGLLLPQSGEVRVGPYTLTDPDVDLRAVRRMAGLLFQIPENQLFETYVGDEIAYGPRRLGFEGDALRQRVRAAMDAVGLPF
ncbi:MAG TPA: energy-coupling factor transporter ATPase, partial [Anaerolineaceae bacterium]|nr:energy-coupling factor transporter ATPase [Anaerolineaceae bacterium]